MEKEKVVWLTYAHSREAYIEPCKLLETKPNGRLIFEVVGMTKWAMIGQIREEIGYYQAHLSWESAKYYLLNSAEQRVDAARKNLQEEEEFYAKAAALEKPEIEKNPGRDA